MELAKKLKVALVMEYYPNKHDYHSVLLQAAWGDVVVLAHGGTHYVSHLMLCLYIEIHAI